MRGLKQMHDKIESGIQTTLSRKRVDMERRIAKSKLVLGPMERTRALLL